MRILQRAGWAIQLPRSWNKLSKLIEGNVSLCPTAQVALLPPHINYIVIGTSMPQRFEWPAVFSRCGRHDLWDSSSFWFSVTTFDAGECDLGGS